MGFVLRVFVLVVLLFVLRYLISNLISQVKIALGGRPNHMESPPEAVARRAHKDPQCGMYVAEELAIRATAGGQEHYFCSVECRDGFLGRAESRL